MKHPLTPTGIQEAKELVSRCAAVILSCETMGQLAFAVRYASLAYNKLSKNIGLVTATNFVSVVERAINISRRDIKH